MPRLVLSDDKQHMILFCTFDERHKAKKVGGAWEPRVKGWRFAFDLNVLEAIQRAFYSSGIEYQLGFEDQLDAKKREVAKIATLKKLAEDNHHIDFDVPGLSLNGENPLYNYQRHGVRCGYVATGGFLLADEMGLGKSIQALGISLLKKRDDGARSCLIICPASVKYNWLNEVHKFTNETAIVIDGPVTDRFNKWFATDYFYKIVNYEILIRDLFYFGDRQKDEADKKNRDYRIPSYEQIIDNWFQVVIVDEAHYIQSHGAQRTIAVKSLKCKHKLALTGTPIDGHLGQLHSLFEFVKPGLFPSRAKFLDHHAIFDFWGGVKSYIRVDEFKEKIEPYYIRRLKKDVLTDLPDKIYKDVYVELSSKSMKVYKELAKREHEITKDNQMIVTIIRCRQFCDMPEILGIELESEKLNTLKVLLEEIVKQDGNKVIIFSQYTMTTGILERELGKDYNIHTLASGKTRFESCEMFNNDPKAQLMIMTDAGSVGINLQSASYVIMYDEHYSPAIMEQRAARAHRIGQKNTVTVIRFICVDTIEERVRATLMGKMKFNDQVLDEDFTEMSVGKALSTQELFNLL